MNWKVLAESVAGTAHRRRNVPCQDAFRTWVFGPTGDFLAVAVADGAGSAALGEVGAAMACEGLVRDVEEAFRSGTPIGDFTGPGLIGLLSRTREGLAREAERRECRLREFACTTLLAVIGSDTAAFAQIGDGAIILSGDGLFRPVFWPHPAEYANATDFLTDERFPTTVQTATVVERVVGVAFLTDGLQRLALDFGSRTGYPGFFRPFFHGLQLEPDPAPLLEPLRDFLDSDRVNDRTDDDKTLVLATRHTPHEPTTSID